MSKPRRDKHYLADIAEACAVSLPIPRGSVTSSSWTLQLSGMLPVETYLASCR